MRSWKRGPGFCSTASSPRRYWAGLLGHFLLMAAPKFSRLRRRVMRLDLAWDRPARRYVQLYKKLIPS